MVNPLYTSAIYEEEQNELNDCISVISNISSFDKKYIEGEREYLNRLFSVVIANKNNFYKLDEEKREKIKKVADFLSSKYNKVHTDDNYFYNFLYSLFTLKHNNREIIASPDEKLTLFIETIDPDLKMYYYLLESKSLKEAEEKITKEFGFFDERLCYVEQYYKKRFIDETDKPIMNI